MALNRRKKPTVNDWSDRYLHMSAIPAALQRLEKLVCANPTLGTELKECLYSRNTLTSLSKLLRNQVMETSLGTGLKTSITEYVFALIVVGLFESTGGAGFGFTQNSNDFL